jgi:hypothetical protein
MNLRNLGQYIHQSWRDASTCEACGAEFTCGAGATAGCWCSEVKLSEALRARLRERYERCLCRACLESFAELEKGAIAESNGEKEKQVSARQAH